MTRVNRIAAKAIDPESRSDAIVVSFGAHWYQRLREKGFTAVIRKKMVKVARPQWMYLHFNAPKGAICARARIGSIEIIDRSTALELATRLALSSDEVLKYMGPNLSIGCYNLGEVTFARTDATTERLATRIAYYPPQSFLILSKEARHLLDEMCGFT